MKYSIACYTFLMLCIPLTVTVSAQNMLEQHFAAVGGKERLAKVETIHRSGTVEGESSLGAFSGVFEESSNLVKLFGYDAIELSISGYAFKIQSGWGDGEFWKHDTRGGFSEMESAEANFIAYGYAPSPLAAVVMANPTSSVTIAGPEDFHGTQCDVVTVEGRDEKFYLNRATHLLEGIAVPGLMNMTFSDYEAVEGLQVPGKKETEIVPRAVNVIYDYGLTKLNAPVDPNRIKKPGEIPTVQPVSTPKVDVEMTGEMLMGYLDKNGDERIDLREYIQSHASDPAGKVLKNFNSIDVSGDQLIDVTEAEAMAKYALQQRDKQNGLASGASFAGVTARQLVGAMDKNNDNKIAKNEAVEDVKVAFSDLDANGDGFIDVAEAEVMAKYANEQSVAKPQDRLKTVPETGGVTAQQIVDNMDKNGDDKISKDEASEDLKSNFQYVDMNGDGVIDMEEAEAIADYVNRQ